MTSSARASQLSLEVTAYDTTPRLGFAGGAFVESNTATTTVGAHEFYGDHHDGYGGHDGAQPVRGGRFFHGCSSD
ncbi:hypothetical protein CI238_10538 [Colletotrichum incanum]|uniref:Uncharacterized protein n=1 Tax=Colletotrichum incanum TaxID=1573173 RepID=A0A167E6J1_COLIC|nr:hypothetical protein CI238_10538 [Colletotrichum incanum]